MDAARRLMQVFLMIMVIGVCSGMVGWHCAGQRPLRGLPWVAAMLIAAKAVVTWVH